MSKPNPALFVKACEIADADPSQTFYIGDNMQKDAIGAYQAGLNGVWLNRNRTQTSYSIYTIDTLADFKPADALQWTQTSRDIESYR